MITWITEKIKEFSVVSFVLSPIWLSTSLILFELKYLTSILYLISVVYFILVTFVSIGVACE